jgi:hypothetical protein
MDMPGTGPVATCEGRFLPLKPGARWTYRVRDSLQVPTMKTQTIEAEEPVPRKPGVRAFRAVVRKGLGLADMTVSWQQVTPDGIHRHQEDSYRPGLMGAPPTLRGHAWWEPHKLRIDERRERLRQGAVWTVRFKESSVDAAPGSPIEVHDRSERWSVVSVGEEVTVPAGTFKDTLQLRKIGDAGASTEEGGGTDKRYWFACGVGKLREEGMQTEELVSFEGL